MNGIQVDTSLVFPYRATFDFEVLFENTYLLQPKTSDPKTQYTAKHLPMSISVCSNVPSFEDHVCFISDGGPQLLVNKMVDYFEEVSDHAYHLLRKKKKSLQTSLTSLMKKKMKKKKKKTNQKRDHNMDPTQ